MTRKEIIQKKAVEILDANPKGIQSPTSMISSARPPSLPDDAR
jgi:hypothetical protein